MSLWHTKNEEVLFKKEHPLKVECSRQKLFEALSVTCPVASSRTALPILQTLRLEAENGYLNVLGCDGEIWAEHQIPARVAQSGSVCLSAKLLLDLVSSLPDGDISLEQDGNLFYLKQGNSDWKMLPLPADQFPEPPYVESHAELKLPVGEIQEAISCIDHATAEDESRPILTGILFSYDGVMLTMVATDTYRLAVLHMDKPGIGAEIEVVVPEKALKALKNLPLALDKEITLCFDDRRLFIETEDSRIVAQLLAGSFPNWKSVIAGDRSRSWTFDRKEFIEHLKRAMILGRDAANKIYLKGFEDLIEISAQSADKGEAKEEVEAVCKHNGVEEVRFALNGRYMLDALTALKSEEILAEFEDAARPIVLRGSEKGDQHYCMIMPMVLG